MTHLTIFAPRVAELTPPEKKLPDLKVEKIEFSDSDPADGDDINITAVIKNLGDAKAEGIVVGFYLGAELIEEKEIEALDAGATTNVSITWEAKEGDHKIRVKLDVEKKIEEKDDTNNELSTDISVKEAGGTCMAVFFLAAIPLAIGVGLVRKKRE